MTELSPSDFDRIARLARDRWGLNLTSRKMPLVSNRLNSFLRKSDFPSVEAYLDYLHRSTNSDDMLVFFDILSTNVTSFFRDMSHFEYLEREFYTPLARGNLTTPGRRIRLWSAGCSNGCEPYSLAINALESLPDIADWDVRILATDLSSTAVEQAQRGEYESRHVTGLNPEVVRRYFEADPEQADRVRVSSHVRSLVSVARLNLNDTWPMRGPFDVIFCRNVMIYFGAETREALVNRFHDLLRPGGILAIGSAETLSGVDVPLEYVQASIYRK